MNSSFGNNIKVNIYGGSHEPEIGVIITGLPVGTSFDMEKLQKFLDRRAPGNSPFATPRKEPDTALPQEGLKVDGTTAVTTDETIKLIIKNTNTRSQDYKNLRDVPRPGHADYTAFVKYGSELNMAGGGPFSARLTAPLCIAGGIAMQLLEQRGVEIGAHIYSVGDVCDTPVDPLDPQLPWSSALARGAGGDCGGTANSESANSAAANASFPVIDEAAGEKMQEIILAAKEDGDSVGGIAEVFAKNFPAGIGGPMYDGVEGVLAPIFFGIPAVKGIEFGAGFAASKMRGSENNDPFRIHGDSVITATNNHGGVLGGITSGMPIIARLAFKPTPSISKEQQSVSLSKHTNEILSIKGRHDPCVVLRAVPICEAAMAIGLLDMLLEETK